MDMEAMIDNLAAKVPTDDNTYLGENGLLHCKKCHTPRQCVVEFLGNVKTVGCICKCMEEERDREEEARKKHERMMQTRRFREAGFPDRELAECTFDADDGARPELSKAMQSYVDNFPNLRKNAKGLFLYGNVGTGKTFLAACVVNALIDQGYPCLMTDFRRISNQLFGLRDGKQVYIDNLTRFCLVAIDDLGVERNTEYMNETVTTVINALYRAGVPMIITSNYTPRQLTEEVDIERRRAYDRLLQVCHPVEINGPSRRKEMGRKDYHDMKRLLGL